MAQSNPTIRDPEQLAFEGREALAELARTYVSAFVERHRASNEDDIPIDGNGFTNDERVGGALLDAIAHEIRPALREVSTIVLGDGPLPFLMTRDGRFLRIEAGQNWPVPYTALLVRLESDLRGVLDDIERALRETEHPVAVSKADFVRRLCDSIEVGIAQSHRSSNDR